MTGLQKRKNPLRVGRFHEAPRDNSIVKLNILGFDGVTSMKTNGFAYIIDEN